jgi:hypothetical protein
MGLHGERGEHFWVGVHNAGAQTLDEVVLLAQEGWFVEHTIAVAHPVFGEFGPKKARVPTVAKFPSLHPGVTEMVNLFGLNYQATPNKSDVLGNVRKFTLEAQARDVRTATAEFEYDPNRRPMVMRS